jgi:hypothetical protein
MTSNDYRSEGFHFSPIVIMSIERSVIDGTGHDDGRAGIWISGACQVTVNDEPLPVSPATAGNSVA